MPRRATANNRHPFGQVLALLGDLSSKNPPKPNDTYYVSFTLGFGVFHRWSDLTSSRPSTGSGP